jgi:sensor histidine kinase YesM
MGYINDSQISEGSQFEKPGVRSILVHFTVWLAFMCYEQLSLYIVSGSLGNLTGFLYFYSCNIGLFYCHAIILNKTLSGRKRQYGLMLVGILSELLVFMGIKCLWEYYWTIPPVAHAADPVVFRKILLLDLVRNFYYIAFATAYWAIRDVSRSRARTAASELEKIRVSKAHADLEINYANARNAYLQQQLNPHLLFNTLSFIYNSVYRSSAIAGKAVLLLSDIMRYSYKALSADGRVLLRDEIEHVRKLIEINRYRFDYPLLLDMTLAGEPGELRIIPLVLVTLCENMFKHGIFRNNAGLIHIEVNGQQLHFSTVNENRLTTNGVPGVGLANTMLRLDHSYKGAYQLEAGKRDNFFILDLTLKL